MPVERSFTLHKTPMSREAAQAAGIPIIDSYKDNPMDRELQKIQADHHDKENKQMKESFFLGQQATPADIGRPESLEVGQVQMDRSISSLSSDDRPSPKTSFAQIKKAKDSGEVSPIMYTAQTKGPQKGALKSNNNTPNKGGPKKTTFATLPNTTTWQESAAKKNTTIQPPPESADRVEPLPSELIDIRMRLEERRRQIETDKRRMQAQLSKQRQQVGKEAFIQV